MNDKEFSKGVERLINPIDVGGLHFIQPFNKLLPRKLQNKIVTASGRKIPYMGFVVEPYSFFLCYEIKDIERAKQLLPDGFELVKTSIFVDDEPKYYCIFGCFTAHTSAFWGSRTEFYLIAEDQKTKLLSWIIVDYDSNTISYDTKYGLRSPNSSKAVITTTHRGNILIDIPRDDNSRHLSVEAAVNNGTFKNLSQRLWLEGNLSVGYGKVLSENSADIFSLKFDPLEVEKALQIPLSDVQLQVNSWFPGLFNDTPSQVVCFPYAQHFISDSPGHTIKLKDKAELVDSLSLLDFSKMTAFSTKSFKTMFLVSSMVSTTITLILLLVLLIR